MKPSIFVCITAGVAPDADDDEDDDDDDDDGDDDVEAEG